MTMRTLRGDPAHTRPLPPAVLRAMYESSGRRWFTLGAILLAIMGVAVWTVRHDPIAISALFFAIAAILKVVPEIMRARSEIVYGNARAEGQPDPDHDDRPVEAGRDLRAPASQAPRT